MITMPPKIKASASLALATAAIYALRQTPMAIRGRLPGATFRARHKPGMGWSVRVKWASAKLPMLGSGAR